MYWLGLALGETCWGGLNARVQGLLSPGVTHPACSQFLIRLFRIVSCHRSLPRPGSMRVLRINSTKQRTRVYCRVALRTTAEPRSAVVGLGSIVR